MALIDIHNLTKVYGAEGAETAALRGVSFAIEAGEFVAVMGPSGSGKSTLLHILGLLDRQTSGTYRFDGQSSETYTTDALAQIRNRRIGFVFQAFNLLPRTTVFENVGLPLRYSDVAPAEWDGRVREAIERVGLTHRSHHTPAQLSGGEQQRAAIARALVVNPAVIFADEPTGNLDTVSGQNVMAIIDELRKERGHTIVLITHDPKTALHAQRILHFRDGVLERDERTPARV